MDSSLGGNEGNDAQRRTQSPVVVEASDRFNMEVEVWGNHVQGRSHPDCSREVPLTSTTPLGRLTKPRICVGRNRDQPWSYRYCRLTSRRRALWLLNLEDN